MHKKLLNIAATSVGTKTLGPGFRSVVWVQGCELNCPGCISPDWIHQKDNQLIEPAELASQLMDNPKIDGLTISGGEPMLQAEGLSDLILEIQKIKPVDVICFTGYKYERLTISPLYEKVMRFLSLIDLLIDGPYIEKLNDNHSMRGSSNQRFFHLTDKLKNIDFNNWKRKIEYKVEDGNLMMIGVPPTRTHHNIDHVIARANQEAIHVRS